MYVSFSAITTKTPQIGGLKTTKIYFSQSWKLQLVSDEGSVYHMVEMARELSCVFSYKGINLIYEDSTLMI